MYEDRQIDPKRYLGTWYANGNSPKKLHDDVWFGDLINLRLGAHNSACGVGELDGTGTGDLW